MSTSYKLPAAPRGSPILQPASLQACHRLSAYDPASTSAVRVVFSKFSPWPAYLRGSRSIFFVCFRKCILIGSQIIEQIDFRAYRGAYTYAYSHKIFFYRRLATVMDAANPHTMIPLPHGCKYGPIQQQIPPFQNYMP